MLKNVVCRSKKRGIRTKSDRAGFNVHSGAIVVYPDWFNVYPDWINVYPDWINVHPGAINVHPDWINVHPGAINFLADCYAVSVQIRVVSIIYLVNSAELAKNLE